MRIALTIESLDAGGAQRVAVNLLNHWAELGHEVFLLSFHPASRKVFFKLDSRVHLVHLTDDRNRSSILRKVLRLYKRILELRAALKRNKPDVVVSFLDIMNLFTIIASQGLGISIVISERCPPKYLPLKWYWKLISPYVYTLSDLIVIVSPDMHLYYPRFLKKKFVYIPNSTSIKPAINTLSQSRIIMGAGRLSKEKGFDLLLRAFAIVVSNFPEWRLKVYGDGPEFETLMKLRDELKLTEKVEFPGLTRDMGEVLCLAEIFVLSSRYDGWPNVLVEAMACGLPVIAFDCPTGPRNIIRNSIDGLLVQPGNIIELATAIEKLMSSRALREQLSNRAPEILERFSFTEVVQRWDKVVGDCIRM